MSHELADETIKQMWLTAWAAGPLADLKIEHENHRFKEPTALAWGRLTLTTGKTTPQAIGGPTNKLDRTPFFLNLQIFIPETKGSKIAKQAHDAMSALNYQSSNIGNLTINFSTTEKTTSTADKGTAALIIASGYYDLR
jgi:hypothetical protein